MRVGYWIGYLHGDIKTHLTHLLHTYVHIYTYTHIHILHTHAHAHAHTHTNTHTQVENGIQRSDIANYDEIRSAIVEKLELLRDTPTRKEKPFIYHLDVAAMYEG